MSQKPQLQTIYTCLGSLNLKLPMPYFTLGYAISGNMWEVKILYSLSNTTDQNLALKLTRSIKGDPGQPHDAFNIDITLTSKYDEA